MDMHFAAYESFNNFALSNYNKLNNIITGFNLNFENIFKDIINKPLFNNIDFNSISGFNQTFSNSLMDDFTYIENKTEDIVTNNSNISNIIKDNFDYEDFIDEHIKQIDDTIKRYGGNDDNNFKIIIKNYIISKYPEVKPRSTVSNTISTIFRDFIIGCIIGIVLIHYEKNLTNENDKNIVPKILHTNPTNFENCRTIN